MKKIIIYDFDGTLTPNPIPRFEILEKFGIKNGLRNPEFMKKVALKSKTENINLFNALFEICFDLIKENGYKINDDTFSFGADNVDYNEGVIEFLDMLCKNNIDNYLLSSGIKVFLNKTIISKYFKDIYATTFNYDENKEATSCDFIMSDKNKVTAIKEILRNNNIDENDCTNVIYIGDGLTDYYAMEYVKNHNGISIFVYQDSNSKEITDMKEKGVVSLFTKADYRKNSKLYKYINSVCEIK